MQQLILNTVHSIESVHGKLEMVKDAANAVALAVTEQGQATQDISRSLAQASQGTEQVAVNVSKVLDVANQSEKESQIVHEISLKMETHMSVLNREMSDIRTLIDGTSAS